MILCGKYLPNVTTEIYGPVAIFQNGTKSGYMEFVQRKDIPLDDAINYSGSASNAVVIRTIKTQISKSTGINKTIIQNYLNSDVQYHSTFLHNNIAYGLYIGINHTTDTFVDDVSGDNIEEPDYVTGVSAFILNLETLEIYKTFYNTESWLYTQKGYGNILSYSYDVNDNRLVLVADQDGYGSSDGAYMSITKIATDGTRYTQYLTITDTTDYTYKKVTAVTYSNMTNYFYVALSSYANNKDNYVTKIIETVNYNDTFMWYYPIYTSSVDMQDISILWGNFMNAYILGLLYYKKPDSSTVIRSIPLGLEVALYGMPDDLCIDDFGIDDSENLYVDSKASDLDTDYNIYAINKSTLDKTLVIQNAVNPTDITQARNWNYTYNRKLCYYQRPNIIKSLDNGTLVSYNYDCDITSKQRNVYGIVKENSFIAKGLFNMTNLSITADAISSYILVFRGFEYSNITSFPIKYNLCIVGNTNSALTNSYKTEKYNSIPITNSSDEESSLVIDLATQSTRRILGE